jgi:hypothetical protein
MCVYRFRLILLFILCVKVQMCKLKEDTYIVEDKGLLLLECKVKERNFVQCLYFTQEYINNFFFWNTRRARKEFSFTRLYFIQLTHMHDTHT